MSNKKYAETFDIEIEKYADRDFPEQVRQYQRVLALDLFRRVVNKTPVGNPSRWKNPDAAPKGYVGGHARLNWQVSLNSPVDTELPGEDASGGNAQMGALTTLGSMRAFDTIWICNNVPYILVLEAGRGPDESGTMRGSMQAPKGMVSVSLQEIKASFG